MGSKIVSSVLENQLRSSPLIRPVDIVKDFKRNYGIEISYYNAWKGKEMAKRDVHGDKAMSYKHLEWYVNELEKTNPGSYTILECDADHRFVRIYPLAYAIVTSEDENNWTWFMENLNNILKDQGRTKMPSASKFQHAAMYFKI
ncbi:hypothetical protein ACLB2K_044014 [Fragaria x ananassa]